MIVQSMNLIHDSQKKSLKEAIAGGESDRLQFKVGFDQETIQTLAAFANTRGDDSLSALIIREGFMAFRQGRKPYRTGLIR